MTDIILLTKGEIHKVDTECRCKRQELSDGDVEVSTSGVGTIAGLMNVIAGGGRV